MSRKYIKGQFSSVVSNSLRPHEPQHARPPCPSPTPGVYSDSCPSSQWCRPAISSCRLVFSLKVKSTVNQSHDYTHSTACAHAQLRQPCPARSDPTDCSPPGSSVHGTSQARILDWMVISFSRGSSQPRDRTHISCIVGRFLYHWAT